MSGLVITSLCASLIYESKNSDFFEGRAALLSEKELIDGLEWAGGLKWFAVSFSGTEEEEEASQTEGVRGNTVVAGSCGCAPGVMQRGHL